MTDIIKIDQKKIDKKLIAKAGKVLREGGLVAFPTETVYGLGANALDEKAVLKIFKAKGRPSDNPLIVHIASQKELSSIVASVPLKAKKLMKKFWPGPLSIILKKKDSVPDIVSAKLDTIAVRMPANKVALALLREAKVPVAAPSANLSGKPSSTTGKDVIEDFMGKVDVIIDSEQSLIGLESTVIDVTGKIPLILRPGKVTLEEIKRVIGRVEHDPGILFSEHMVTQPRSPGMKYKHYSPNAKLIIIMGEKHKAIAKAREIIMDYKNKGKKTCVIRKTQYAFPGVDIIKQVDPTDKSYAREIFRIFRECDREGVDVIVTRAVDEQGLGMAIMNRLRKAAFMIINVDKE